MYVITLYLALWRQHQHCQKDTLVCMYKDIDGRVADFRRMHSHVWKDISQEKPALSTYMYIVGPYFVCHISYKNVTTERIAYIKLMICTARMAIVATEGGPMCTLILLIVPAFVAFFVST